MMKSFYIGLASLALAAQITFAAELKALLEKMAKAEGGIRAL